MQQIYDESTSYLLQPDLTDEYLQDLDRVCDRICQAPNDREDIVTTKIDDVEQTLPARPPQHDTDDLELYMESVKYLAVLEALLDLLEIGYYVEKNPAEIEGIPPVRLYPPDSSRFDDDPEAYKERERRVLQKERQAQFDDSMREFVREMETPDRHNGRQVDITDLITDGSALYNDLDPISSLPREEIVERLDTAVQPYVQVAEKGETDPHTGFDLHDIWRYFRYTWLTPYNSVPGRNIKFLVRDAARDRHPIIGIASLASSMMNLSERDNHIGWKLDGLKETLKRRSQTVEYEETLSKDEREPGRKTRTVTRTEYLETQDEFEQRVTEHCELVRTAVENVLEERIDQIRYDDFIEWYDDLSSSDLAEGTDAAFRRLKQIEGLATYIFKQKPPLTTEVDDPDEHKNIFNPAEFGLSENDLDNVDIEDTDPDKLDNWQDKSETALFVRKRARQLQTLLQHRGFFADRETEDDRVVVETAFESEDGQQALKTALKELKKRRVGAGMMNIQVCGAIPPYNHILGGKLVAMALTGPAVIEAYREKYEGYISKIASGMAGEPVIKNNELVFLDTTGLFGTGSAQYDRIRVPTPQDQIEYEEVGKTKGYGSIQFGPDARTRLAQVTEYVEDRKAVKGRFGEGIAPKMRKIRRGLNNLDLDGGLIKHESQRVIYAVELADKFREFLFSLTDDPVYYWEFDDPDAEQQSIYDHWKHRWVSKRIQKEDILMRLDDFNKEADLELGHEIDFKNHTLFKFR